MSIVKNLSDFRKTVETGVVRAWAKKGAKSSHLMCFYKGNQVIGFQLYMIMLQIIY